MSEKMPAFQFYVKDWLSDDKLRLCSLAARGMWIDMLCLMFNSEERGRLVTAGEPWTDEQIVYSVSCPDQIDARYDCLAELKRRSVAKVDDRGAVFNSRMVHDEHVRQVRAESGSAGGKQKASKMGSKTSSKTLAKIKQTSADADADIRGAVRAEENIDPSLFVNGATLDLLHDWLGHARVSSHMLFEVGCLIRDYTERTVQEGIKISIEANAKSLPYLRAVVENGAQRGAKPMTAEEIPF